MTVRMPNETSASWMRIRLSYIPEPDEKNRQYGRKQLGFNHIHSPVAFTLDSDVKKVRRRLELFCSIVTQKTATETGQSDNNKPLQLS